MLLQKMTAADEESSVTYMLVVDDHTILTGGTVGTYMLLDAPVTSPSAQNTTTATARRKQSLQPGRCQQDETTPADVFPQKLDQQMIKIGKLTVNGQTAASQLCSRRR